MPTTTRFGLNKFSPDIGGALSDDGSKYSSGDRDTIDALLEAFENHGHNGGTRVSNPTAAPTLAQAATGGALAGGTAYYYRVSYVDQFGLESAASDEGGIITPAQVEAPSAPTLATQTGGTLTPGAHYYVVTAVAGDYETEFSTPAVISLLPDRDAILVTMPALPAGASTMAVWRMGPEDDGYTRLGESTTTFLDDGAIASDDCACDPANLPGTENRTNSENQVTIHAPDTALLAGGLVSSWRIYRTTISGGYATSSLVADVADLDDAGDLVTSYVDRGETLLPGVPLEVSQTLKPSSRVTALAGGSGGSGHLFLNDSSDETWRVTCDLSGQLETRKLTTAMTTAPTAINLRDDIETVWRLTVTTSGELVTTDNGTTAADDEFLYEVGGGPHINSPDTLETFQLSVATDGALVTIGGQADPATYVVGVNTRQVTVANTAPTEAAEGDIWITPAGGVASGPNPHNTTLDDLSTLVTGRDVEITDAARGAILRSPNGTRYRVTVGDDGALTTAVV